jgi:hypothetical protein
MSSACHRRYPHAFLLPRVWELRNNLTAYDAVYIALAEKRPPRRCSRAIDASPPRPVIMPGSNWRNRRSTSSKIVSSKLVGWQSPSHA